MEQKKACTHIEVLGGIQLSAVLVLEPGLDERLVHLLRTMTKRMPILHKGW